MSYRSDNGAHYDRTLLSSVPDPTRAEKQEGYNVDLLDEGRPSDGNTPATAIGYSPGAVSYARKEEAMTNGHELAVTKVPWYRKTWGIALIVIVVFLVIGAVVGGVVGGTHHSSHPKDNTAAASQGQGQGQHLSSTDSIGQQIQGGPTASPTPALTSSTPASLTATPSPATRLADGGGSQRTGT